MFSRLKGEVVSFVGKEAIELRVSGITYKIYVCPIVCSSLKVGLEIELFIYHYFHTELGRMVPVLIGFLCAVEREFFELFITVSGIGPKAAIKSFTLPVSKIAEFIYNADVKGLCSMPGIGKHRAKQIIAKLQDKVAKFALLKDEVVGGDLPPSANVTNDAILDEAYQILLQLQYKKAEAKNMINKVKQLKKHYNSVEEVLADVYRIV